MKKLIILLLLFNSAIYAQDFSFSQWQKSAQFVNPAYNFRNQNRIYYGLKFQQPSLSNSITTQVLSYHTRIRQIGGFIGGFLMHDAYLNNASSISQIGIDYNYVLLLSRKFSITFGVSPQLQYRRFNPNKFAFQDQIFPRDGVINDFNEPNQAFGFDSDIGIVFRYSEIYLGFNTRHLLQSNLYRPTLYSLQIGNTFLRKFENHLLDVGLLAMSQDNFNYLVFNISYQFKFIYGGINYQIRNNFGFHLGTRFKGFDISYQYDMMQSLLTNASGTNHELSLSWYYKSKRNCSGCTRISMPDF
ncbi:PorP/SprF family type IX secretion system membrane protein [Paracrocinitomix mangrovi]|uniref:PorP/SprF family type IX secretion system membrane protein n=1 Tax=Paracrocinitomix mangrovi TaxID=2862509 RepID=UPI001C8DCDEF|nr:PorP/SprF family type IX secretion system membrane protein [Paracrocinitomix mangrovi]UKN00111.1 PorP/SprF family type IX secretion system membrane protein [Paracrocinitomix mangrovi]